MKTFTQFIAEENRSDIIDLAKEQFPAKNKFAWKGNPNIGWWADRNSLLLYHGTHYKNLLSMLENGIKAPSVGPTANWVSLALEPNTAFGYASMGGESGFRAAGAKAVTIPPNDRVVLVLKMPMTYVKKMMHKDFPGNMEKEKLRNKDVYDKSKVSDQEYYALTELQFPKLVDPKFIIGYMTKK